MEAITPGRRLVLQFLFLIMFALPACADSFNLGLMDAATLNRGLSRWVVIDARPRAEWQAGHIPGARSLSWEEYTRTDSRGVQYKIRPPEEMARALGEMGIDEKTPLVVYGDADKSWGGEGWDCWALALLGHRGPVRLLAGGMQAWKGSKLPLAAGQEKQEWRRTRYSFRLQPRVDIPTKELEGIGSAASVVDTRSTIEWLLGRIPGAIHIPWEKFYSGSDRRPLAPEKVRELLKEHGVPAGKPVVYYCEGGIRSAFAWTVHQLAGLPPARNYEGGYEEWKKTAKR